MTTTPTAHKGLSGPQKAAVLLIQLGKERAASVLRNLREREVEKIMSEVAQIQDVSANTVTDVIGEFHDLMRARNFALTGGLDYARDLLEEGLGVNRAHEILDRLSVSFSEMPFDFLRRADPRQVLSFLQDEHPQTIALVLAHMHPEQGAVVLSGLPETLQADVARRIAVMDRTSPEVIRQVEGVLERKLSSVIQAMDLASAGGIQPLVDILNRAGRTAERSIIEGLERDDPELAEKVRSMLFVFEDIVLLDDRSMQMVLREVDTKDLAVAIKGVNEDVKNKIIRNMSERAADNLLEESESLGPVRLKTVEEAQSKVVRVIRRLEEAEQITLSRGNEEFVG